MKFFRIFSIIGIVFTGIVKFVILFMGLAMDFFRFEKVMERQC